MKTELFSCRVAGIDTFFEVIQRRVFLTEAVAMNGRFQMQEGKNWILPK
jgi:hypothetical protein